MREGSTSRGISHGDQFCAGLVEIAGRAAPHAVHVIGVVLRVVVLDEKRRSLQAIRVLGVAFEAAPPGQPNLVEARRFELRLGARRECRSGRP